MVLMRSSGEAQLIQRAETTSSLFASMVKDPVLSYDLATLETFIIELMKNRGLAYVRVYDQDQLLSSSGDKKLLLRPFQADSALEWVNDAVFDISAIISESGQVYGHIELGLYTEALQQRLSSATLSGYHLQPLKLVRWHCLRFCSLRSSHLCWEAGLCVNWRYYATLRVRLHRAS